MLELDADGAMQIRVWTQLDVRDCLSRVGYRSTEMPSRRIGRCDRRSVKKYHYSPGFGVRLWSERLLEDEPELIERSNEGR